MKIYVVEITKVSGTNRKPFGSDCVGAMECERANHGFAKIFVLTLDFDRSGSPKIVSYEPWE